MTVDLQVCPTGSWMPVAGIFEWWYGQPSEVQPSVFQGIADHRCTVSASHCLELDLYEDASSVDQSLLLSKAELKELAERYPPPQEWFEDDDLPF